VTPHSPGGPVGIGSLHGFQHEQRQPEHSDSKSEPLGPHSAHSAQSGLPGWPGSIGGSAESFSNSRGPVVFKLPVQTQRVVIFTSNLHRSCSMSCSTVRSAADDGPALLRWNTLAKQRIGWSTRFVRVQRFGRQASHPCQEWSQR
jgi:hypothetical protein